MDYETETRLHRIEREIYRLHERINKLPNPIGPPVRRDEQDEKELT